MTIPAKKADFPGSARRHMSDAQLLEKESRMPNAGHLYGFVAECGLKALLIWHGYPTDAEGSPESQHGFKQHVDRLVIATTLGSLKAFLNTRSGAKYLAMIPSISAFSDWRVAHRYFSEGELPQSFAQWKTAAYEVARMLDQARLDGMA